MDKLHLMVTFAHVFKGRSFSAAADRLGVTPAVVTKRMAALEQALGARLFNRTTRKVQPTDIGVQYFDFCSRVLNEIEAAEADVARQQQEPRGTLRISVPKAFGSLHMGEAIADFIARYPLISVSILNVNDAPLDTTRILAERFDLAIRMSRPPDSSVMARRVCKLSWVACAAPKYLKSVCGIRAPSDLAKVNCLLHEGPLDDQYWRFSNRKGRMRVRVVGNMASNSTLTLRGSAIGGLGVALLPYYSIAADLADGRLVRVLPHYNGPEHELFVVFPYRSYVPHKVRVFIDFLVERFHTPEWSEV